jgi:hypothetical protein
MVHFVAPSYDEDASGQSLHTAFPADDENLPAAQFKQSVWAVAP